MKVDVVLLPQQVGKAQQWGRTVVVFDVLRATTSMAAALHAGAREIRIFADLDSARHAARQHPGRAILCGESECLAPPGFDMGNSPEHFARVPPDSILFMSTTNGTRAIVAAQHAAIVLTAALVNASAAAHYAAGLKREITLLCAGTQDQVAMEDIIGAGAVADALVRTGSYELAGDTARVAVRLFQGARSDLRSVLLDAQGGRNVVAAGLPDDIGYAARLDTIHAVGRVELGPLRVVKACLGRGSSHP